MGGYSFSCTLSSGFFAPNCILSIAQSVMHKY